MNSVSIYYARDKLLNANPALRDYFVAQKLVPLIGGAMQRALGHRSPRVNDVIRIHGRGSGAQKRYIVFWTKGSAYGAVALSGADKGSLLVYDSVGGIEPDYVNAPAVWTSATARERYDDYVARMKKAENDDLVLPFRSAEERPDEVFEIPESDEAPDVTIRHRAVTGTIADFPKNRAIYDIVRRYGFVWAPRDKVVRRAQSVGNPTIDHQILRGLKDALNRAGFKVAFDVIEASTREEIQEAHGAKRTHMLGRAEMMRERSGKAAERAQRAATIAGQSANEALSKLHIPGYYPAPPDLVGRVVELADIGEGDAVLEPSAGTAALADAATAVGGEVDVVEVDPRLQAYLKAKGHALVAHDIMKFRPGSIYDAIVMNPPFENGQDADHVRHAYELLRPGGRLVAIMSEGPFFRAARRDAEFREWLEGIPHETEKHNATFGRATVNVRIVTIDKPEDARALEPNTAVIEGIVYARSQAGMGNAEEIATELVEKAGTSKRAQRRLEKAKQDVKDESRKAALYASRAEGITRAALRVGEVKPVAPKAKDVWAKGDRVWYMPRWGDSGAGVIERVDKLSVRIRLLDGRLVKAELSSVHDLDDAIAAGRAPAEAREAAPAPKPVAEELRNMIKGGVKRDLGATLHRKEPDSYGAYIGWGEVKESWHGKRAEREVYYEVMPSRELGGRGGTRERGYARAWLRGDGFAHGSIGRRAVPDVEVILTDAEGQPIIDADQAYKQFVARLREKLS